MKSVEKKAYAKINLSLDVVRRREDGYHDLEMIMQQIGICDIIRVEETEGSEIEISADGGNIPTDSDNIVYKISYTLKERFNIGKGVRIHIEKNIPVAAGLAGGSTDAAAVMMILNEIWNLDMDKDEMTDIAKNIGADIPFFFYGKTALAEGIGEKITPLSDFSGRKILLVNPGVPVNTGHVYKNLKLDENLKRPDNKELIEFIENGETQKLAENMANVLESVTIAEHPVIDEIKKEMMDCGALGSMMSGSGPTVFGIFDKDSTIETAYERMKEKYKTALITETI